MQRFSFRRGMRLLEGPLRLGYEVSRRLATGKIQLISDTGEIVTLTDTELHLKWLSGEWTIDIESLGSSKDAIYLTVPRGLDTYPESQQAEAKRRKHYLDKVAPEKTPYDAERWRLLIHEAAQEIGDSKPPNPSTVHAWWRRFRLTKSINTLIPHNKPSAGPRASQVYLMFEEVVATVYLSTQQLPKLAVVEELFRRVDGVNNSRAAEEIIARPAQSTVYRWIDNLQQDLVDQAREGAEAARMKYRAALGNVKVDCVLERLEIDHTPLDIIVIDPVTQLPLGRPWLTMGIDCYCKMAMGFYVSFNAPSSHSVLQCLRRSILPKSEWLARFPDIKCGWPAQGIPELIAVDNGTDLHSEALESACLEMGIQILFCGSKTPQHKGAIERFFRTMNKGLIHRVPGSVFSSVDERGDYASEEKAVVDMETLIHLLTKWIVDVYNVTMHRGIKALPTDAWARSADRRIIELPVHPQQMEVITGIPAKRTLFHYGIELDGLQYNSDLVQTLRRRTGENAPVQLKYYEDTVAHIHVYDPLQKEYIRVPAKDAEYTKDLPRSIHRLVRESARKKHGDHVMSSQLLQAKAEIEELIQTALKEKKMGHRKSGARLMMQDSEAVLDNSDPLAKARKSRKSAPSKPPTELPPGLDDDLPDFPSNTGGQ